MAELPSRQDIYGADMRKIDRIGQRLDKTIERIAKLEQRFELLTTMADPQPLEPNRNGKKIKK